VPARVIVELADGSVARQSWKWPPKPRVTRASLNWRNPRSRQPRAGAISRHS